VLTTLPLVIPSYIAAFLYISLLGGGGPVRQFLAANFSLTSLPSIYGFGGAFLVLTFVSFPYVTLTTRASLKRMDPALVEAARSLGLSPRQAFSRITLPYLRPAIVAGALLTTLYVIRDFGAVTMLQYSTFTRVIYNRYLAYRLDSAAGFALMLIALAMALLYLEQRSRGKAVYSRLSTGAARRAKLSRLGTWKAPALAFVSAVVLVTLLLPAYGLGFWLVRGLRNEWMVQLPGAEQSTMQVVAGLVQPAISTISASSLGAIAAAMLALPVAFLIVRRPGRLTRLLERTTYAAFAIPGIVVALAYVFFGARYGGSLYQTLPMMLAAYVVLFIPQAVGAQRASFLQLSPSLEEAGRGLGHGAAVIFRRITIPLVRPGILSGVALVFLTCMKELPATLILSPLGFESLAAQIWSSIGEAFFARAALPAMLLLLLSSLPLAIITLKDTEST
jgi:iron(III) transport system permease protein